jgi:glycerol-3-phosphate acyltransferase PlsY
LTTTLSIAVVLAASYLLGSIPFGYMVTFIARKIDLRLVGSGHTGGTNVLRVAGALPAAITVVLDFAKGYAAVELARALVPGAPIVWALAGLLAVVGHVWSLFLGFKGGVGTMTTGGGAVALMPDGALAAIALSLVAILVGRMSSLGSLLFAALLPLACLVGAVLGAWPYTYLIFALGTSVMATWALRENIKRLRAGTERRIGEPVSKSPRDADR